MERPAALLRYMLHWGLELRPIAATCRRSRRRYRLFADVLFIVSIARNRASARKFALHFRERRRPGSQRVTNPQALNRNGALP